MAKEKKVKNEKKGFMKDFKAELKKVVWPSTKQMVNNVTAVLTIVLITAAIVFVLDLVFGAMNTYGIDKLKNKVIEQNQNEIVQNITTGNETTENKDNQSQQTEGNQTVENNETTQNVDTNNSEATNAE